MSKECQETFPSLFYIFLLACNDENTEAIFIFTGEMQKRGENHNAAK